MVLHRKGRHGAVALLISALALTAAAPAATAAAAAHAAKKKVRPVPDGYYSGAAGGAQVIKGKVTLGWKDQRGTQCTKASGPYTIQGQSFNIGLKRIPANGTLKVHDAFPIVAGLATSPIATQTGTLHVTKGAITGALKVSWTFDGGGCNASAKVALHRT